MIHSLCWRCRWFSSYPSCTQPAPVPSHLDMSTLWYRDRKWFDWNTRWSCVWKSFDIPWVKWFRSAPSSVPTLLVLLQIHKTSNELCETIKVSYNFPTFHNLQRFLAIQPGFYQHQSAAAMKLSQRLFKAVSRIHISIIIVKCGIWCKMKVSTYCY